MLAKIKLNSIAANITSIDWHGNKPWKIYHDFWEER